MVAFDNPAGSWILRHEQNCLLSLTTVDGLRDALERLCTDAELRERLAEQGVRDIASRHSDWDSALSGIYAYLCDPRGVLRESTGMQEPLRDQPQADARLLNRATRL